MSKRILMLDEEPQVNYVAKRLRHLLQTEVDIVRSLDEARMLIQEKKYGCVIVEPLDANFFDGREKESPFLPFIRKAKQDGAVLVIASTYREETFQESFGFDRWEYDLFYSKPFDQDAFIRDITERLK